MNSNLEPKPAPSEDQTLTQNSGTSSPVCQVHGVKLEEGLGSRFCPVCLLQFSTADGSSAPGQPNQVSEDPAAGAKDLAVPSGPGHYLLAHFEVEIGPDGKPVELGHGAMGVTYKAIDTLLRRPVALKVIASRLLGNQSLKSRFIREARAAASLRHPNIASVFYLGSTESSYFYAMELAAGQTLEEIIATQGPLNLLQALDITAQIASALVAAHRSGLVHRDIKPANLIVSFDEKNRPSVKVIDFGLVKVTSELSEDSSASEPGVFLGTPRYASPEQFKEGPVDIRSDIYAIGVTLWQMLTGTTPFSGSPAQVAGQHLQASLPVDKLRHLPRPVITLLTHILEKDPDDRPQTPEELLALLKATMRTLGAPPGILPPEPDTIAPSVRWTSKLPRRVYLGGAALLVAGILTILLLPWMTHRPPIEAQKSVAVLPFDNIGNNSDQEYFSDGLTSDVIFELSKISDLRVISRDSVLRYKAMPNASRKSLRAIGTELEVATILESSVQRVENRVKIVTILYDARTERRLWGRSYDREIKDIFVIQSDLAQNIATALQVRLLPDELTNLQRKPTENLTAYDLYLRGMAFFELRHKEDNERAIALYRQAIEQDSKFALGYAGLANAYIDRVADYEGEMFWLDSAIDLCRQTIALDPSQVRGYTVLARAFSYKGLDTQARELTTKALELAPNDIEAIKRARYEAHKAVQFDEEYSLLRRCLVLDPNDPSNPYLLGKICAAVGERGFMEKWMQRAVDLEADAGRHQMMECERMIFRRDFAGALNGLRNLPLELFSYDHTVLELVVACSARVGDWPKVQRLANARLAQGSGNWSFDKLALSYLALSAHSAGRETEAREMAQRLVASAQESLVGAENFWGHYYLAVGNRFLDQKEKAYEHLRTVFPRVVTALPLLGDDPTLEVFERDAEFQNMMSDIDKKNEKTRTRILEIEKNH
jgi:serine/threonine protein kinase/tetratricopeptide (TPR) repeat protein